MENPNSIEEENKRIKKEIMQMEQSIKKMQGDLVYYLNEMSHRLQNSNESLSISVGKIGSANGVQDSINAVYEKFSKIQSANKTIRELNNIKYYDYKDYRTIRKIVRGIMDNLDLNLISDRAIINAVERKHLANPDYWLTLALLAIMAWKRDDKEVANRALKKSLDLNKKDTCIFFMMFNLRLERKEAATKWFEVYQNCDLYGEDQDTLLWLGSLASSPISDKVSPETKSRIDNYIRNEVNKRLTKYENVKDDEINLLQKKWLSLIVQESFDYPLISKYTKDIGNIKYVLFRARNNEKILSYIYGILNVDAKEKNKFYKEYIDKLISKPNPEEIEISNKIEYNELIIANEGDEDIAKDIYENKKDHEEQELDVVKSMINWVFGHSSETINSTTRLNYFAILKELEEESLEKYFKNYQEKYTETHEVSIDGYETEMNFLEINAEINKVEQYYKGEEENEISAIKNTKVSVSYGLGFVGMIASIFISPFLLGLAAIGGISGTVYLIGNKLSKKNIRINISSRKANTVDKIYSIFSEYDQYRVEFKNFDCITNEIMKVMDSI